MPNQERQHHISRQAIRAKRAKLRRQRRMILTILSLFLLFILGLIFYFGLNRWSVSVTLNGSDQVVLAYGDKYTEEGATATVQGRIFSKKAKPINVKIKGKVDDSKIGTYEIKYIAKKHLHKGVAIRTVTIKDEVAPTIELMGNPDGYVIEGQEYEEEGYKATDNYDGDLTDQVTKENIDGNIVYSVTDSSGNTTQVTREIYYVQPDAPIIQLSGDKEMKLNAGESFTEPGYTCSDNKDGDLTAQVQVSNPVDPYTPGDYEVTYSCTNSLGKASTRTRKVTVDTIRQADNVTPGDKNIYLTFDDGPGPYTEQLLATLDKYNVKVTFFVVNTKYADLMTQEAAAGHTVAMHTASHVYSQIYASEDAYFADLYAIQNIIKEKTGTAPTLFRFPGGSSNGISRDYCPGIMTKLVKDTQERGFTYFDWNVLSGDAGDTKDTNEVFHNVINGVDGKENAIVLQHDIKEFSVNAVERIIVWGLSNGYTFLPLTPDSPTAHHGALNN